jgi:hypothetical protein
MIRCAPRFERGTAISKTNCVSTEDAAVRADEVERAEWFGDKRVDPAPCSSVPNLGITAFTDGLVQFLTICPNSATKFGTLQGFILKKLLKNKKL